MSRRWLLGAVGILALTYNIACSSSGEVSSKSRVKESSQLVQISPLRHRASTWIAGAAIDYYMPADGRQLVAGNQYYALVNQALNDLAYSCMDAFRFHAAQVLYARNAELYLNPPQGSPLVRGWYGENTSGVPNIFDIADLRDGGMLSPVLLGSPNPVRVARAQAMVVISDYAYCQRRATDAFTLVNAAGNGLNEAWLKVVRSLQRTERMRVRFSTFAQCVRAHGAPVPPSASPDGFSVWLSAVVAPRTADPYGDTSLIRSEVVLDKQWTAVFVDCVGQGLKIEYNMQLQAQRLFDRRHARSILKVRRDSVLVYDAMMKQFG